MFEWCFRGRYTTAAFGIGIAASVASFSGILGAGSFAIVLGIAAGMPVLVAGSPSIDGERYLAATSPLQRATDAAVTAAVALLAGLAVTALASEFLGEPIPSVLGAVVAVLGGQASFFVRNREYLDVGGGGDGEES